MDGPKTVGFWVRFPVRLQTGSSRIGVLQFPGPDRRSGRAPGTDRRTRRVWAGLVSTRWVWRKSWGEKSRRGSHRVRICAWGPPHLFNLRPSDVVVTLVFSRTYNRKSEVQSWTHGPTGRRFGSRRFGPGPSMWKQCWAWLGGLVQTLKGVQTAAIRTRAHSDLSGLIVPSVSPGGTGEPAFHIAGLPGLEKKGPGLMYVDIALFFFW